jgi:hypothetical protein
LQFISRFRSLHEWGNRKTETVVENWTKRLILKASASIYDLLGLITPFTIQSKVLLQRLWAQKDKYDWDTQLPEEIVNAWLDWLKGVFELDKIEIPRFLKVRLDSSNIQVHTFVDASHDVYSCVCYIRVTQREGDIDVQLICSKARVTPLKAETVPRLELMACLLGARLAASVVHGLEIQESEVFYWTDSMTCLSWINKPSKCYKAYVANRTGEIQTRTKSSQWYHCPTKQNPADVPTRKISVNELIDCKLWWNGPEFLKLDPEHWPKTPKIQSPDLIIVSGDVIRGSIKPDGSEVEVQNQYEEAIDFLNELTNHLNIV